MKLCFLLGSGISLPAGLPCVDQITRQVLKTERPLKNNCGLLRRMSDITGRSDHGEAVAGDTRVSRKGNDFV